MRPSVSTYWHKFNEPFEGYVHTMYLDRHTDKNKNLDPLVSIGLGNLIDPISQAIGLRFTWRDATKADQPVLRSDIEDEFNRLKFAGTPRSSLYPDDKETKFTLAHKGWKECAKRCQLELDDDAIDELVLKKLANNERILKTQFKDFDLWPADAQLGLLSLSWARGAGGFQSHMPDFHRYLTQPGGPDFALAATAARLTKDEKTDHSHWLRNNANQQLFRNAAAVIAGEDDGFYRREVLYYPTVPPETMTA